MWEKINPNGGGGGIQTSNAERSKIIFNKKHELESKNNSGKQQKGGRGKKYAVLSDKGKKE